MPYNGPPPADYDDMETDKRHPLHARWRFEEDQRELDKRFWNVVMTIAVLAVAWLVYLWRR